MTKTYYVSYDNKYDAATFLDAIDHSSLDLPLISFNPEKHKWGRSRYDTNHFRPIFKTDSFSEAIAFIVQKLHSVGKPEMAARWLEAL